MRRWELATGAAVGLLAGFVLWGREPETREAARPNESRPEELATPADEAPAPAFATQAEVVRLREQLEAETTRREVVERQLATQAEAPVPRSSPSVPDSPSGEGAPPGGWVPEGWPNPEILLQAGLTQVEIDELYQRFETIELERLYVRDAATREGWIGKPRFKRRMRELDKRYRALGDEYGEDAYDWILYAAGSKNRILVTRVMQGSAAEDVGLEAGDIVLRYDDQRIFDGRALQRATTSGEAGETVALDVLRNGELIRVYPPFGPLGITLDSIRVKPGPLD